MSELELIHYQKQIVHQNRHDIENLPVKYRGIVYSTIQYKYLRTEMIKMLGTIMDSIVPPLVKPLQRLTDALIDFSEAYGNNLGIYYSLYISSADFMNKIIAERDTRSSEAFMDAVVSALEVGRDLNKSSTELKEALKQLERTIIELTGNRNWQQLEEDVEQSFNRTKKLMMTLENKKRDLAIENSTLTMVNDSSVSDKEIEQNIQTRITKELQSLERQQSLLGNAESEHGQQQTETHDYYYGWRYWWYGGQYRYTTTTTKDTTSQQNQIRSNMSDIEDRAEKLKSRLEERMLNKNKRREMAQVKISQLTEEIKMLEERRDNELKVAKASEEKLSQARLDAAGCSSETAKKLTEAFKLTLPLFVQLADNTAQVASNFRTAKALIQATAKMPVVTAIAIFDGVTKLAVAGDFVSNNSFTIGSEITFRNQMNVMNEVYNKTVIAAKQLPTGEKTYEKLEMLQDINPLSQKDMEQVRIVSPVKPEDIF